MFDLDDTLYSERDYVRSGARAVASELAMPEAAKELLALEAQDPSAPLYSRWLNDRGLDEAVLLPRMLAVHRGHSPDIALTPGVRALLERLRGRYRLGLVSDGRLDQQLAKAAALGLEAHFDAIVFSDALGREYWKPSPAPYELVLSQLGAQPSEAVYVGDNPAKDFLGARRAGMRSIRVRRPDGLHARTEPVSPDAAPDLEISSLALIEEFLR